MTLTNVKEWNLRHKIVLHIVVIGVLTAIFLTFLFFNTQRNIIHSMSWQKAELAGSMIENSIFFSMKEGKSEEVQSTLEKEASSIGIKKIRILSPEGKILRSTKEDEIGMSAENATLDRINSFLQKNDQSDIIFIKPRSTIQGFRTIENRSECFDCHSSQNKINGILEVNIDYDMASSLLQKSQLQGIIIAFLALGTLSFIIIRLFERLVNRPISRLKEEMKKVQGGNLNINLHPLKNDEIGNLTKSFDVMVRKLREANHQIERLFNKQMEKAEHLASFGEVAAGFAHEIKNPIAGIKGALEVINQGTDDSDTKKEIFTEMLIQIEKINHIVQDLLSYAKPKEMHISLINPNECVENAIKLAKPQINSKEITFHFKGLDNNTLARIDPDKIQEVILNLLLNSISAIKEKGSIAVELDKRNKKELEIKCTDDGVGIKKEHLLQVFNPFFTTKSRGTGLGLSICKKIIEAHNGSMEAKSEEGKGAFFTIQLPVLQPVE